MYRPLAGQLRMLLCDRRPLLTRVFPNLVIGALREIEWLHLDQASLIDGDPARLVVQHPPDQEFRVARMPFLITSYPNGLQVADLQFVQEGEALPLDAWMDQRITLQPLELSLREAIRSVADKGGGAHVDDEVSRALHHMYRTGPADVGVHVLFSIAIGRFAQQIGLHHAQFLERFGCHGRLEDVVFDPEHPTVRTSAQVPAGLENGPRQQYTLTALKRTR